jgi:adenylosuccinate lyase
MGVREQLLAVTPLDGRYAGRVEALSPIVSEYGLIQRRMAVEAAWLSALGSGILPDMPPLSDAAQDYLRQIPADFSVEDGLAVKDIEKTTNHDVKAVEVWLRQKLADHPELSAYSEFIHFGCTSEDISNLAYAMMVRDSRDDVIIPGISSILEDLDDKAYAFADIAMLAHTHGQPATPTTLGKEMRVFHQRAEESGRRLAAVAIRGKFNGASGNYNAVSIAYPEIDWVSVSRKLVEDLDFDFNPATTQIEPHDWTVAFCDELGLNNSIMTDLARDMWTYISMGYFRQQVKAGEVGSSTMPHKVNPIDFENAESNFGSANALFGNLSLRLPISRLQRDLTDSSTQRTFGEAFGHTVVAHSSLKRGLGKVSPNEHKIREDLNGEWAILAEAVQTVMRRYGIEGAYDILKAATRGQSLDAESYARLVASVKEAGLPDEAVSILEALEPSTYVGHAAQIARNEQYF